MPGLYNKLAPALSPKLEATEQEAEPDTFAIHSWPHESENQRSHLTLSRTLMTSTGCTRCSAAQYHDAADIVRRPSHLRTPPKRNL